jgi:hypothetical protein
MPTVVKLAASRADGLNQTLCEGHGTANQWILGRPPILKALALRSFRTQPAVHQLRFPSCGAKHIDFTALRRVAKPNRPYLGEQVSFRLTDSSHLWDPGTDFLRVKPALSDLA